MTSTINLTSTGTEEPPVFEDNPERFDVAFSRVKQTFLTGKTKPYEFRMNQLANLKSGLLKMHAEFDKAMTKDLGKDTFVNWLFELNLINR